MYLCICLYKIIIPKIVACINRKKSTQDVNLRNTDHAEERYDEVLAHVLGKKPKTQYYTESNGKIIKDCITLEGNDWL